MRWPKWFAPAPKTEHQQNCSCYRTDPDGGYGMTYWMQCSWCETQGCCATRTENYLKQIAA